jgi:hypothetical protein
MKQINVYINGDSFTAGTDLADSVLPGAPPLTLDRTHKCRFNNLTDEEKKWAHNRYAAGIKFYGSRENFENAEKSLAWPAELSKINSKIQIQNGAMAGASMIGIAHRTMSDLMLSKTAGINFDFVFIQLTSPSRTEIYDATQLHTKFIYDRPLSWVESFDTVSKRNLGKSYIGQYTPIDFAIKFLYNLCTLKYAIKGLTGVSPIFLSATSYFTDDVVAPIINIKDFIIQNLLKESGILDIPAECCMSTVHDINLFAFTSGGHYEHRTHQAYARIIYDRYIK